MTRTTPLPDRTDSFGFLLSDAGRLLRRRFDQRARALGMTGAQWRVLAHLVRNEGSNQASLADALELEPISLCRLIDRMEDGGWVTRSPDPSDRRARLIHTTEAAQRLFGRMRETAAEIFDVALDGMTAEERDQLFHLLRRVRENLAGR